MFSAHERYPQTSPEEILQLQPDLVLLSSEPFPFSDKHLPALEEALPGTRLVFVDGEMFSWYGSKLLEVPQYIRSLRLKINA
jgi:hypothetical protein